MQTSQPSLFAREDTFLGICEGLGEDLGISPNLLRLSFVPLLYFYPVVAIAAYFGAGVLVLGTRLLFPAPRAITAEPTAQEAAAEQVNREPDLLAA